MTDKKIVNMDKSKDATSATDRSPIIASTKPKYIAALAPFISDEPTRKQLNGIFIEPHKAGGITLTATNGHALGHVYDRTGKINRPAILPIEDDFVGECLESLKFLECDVCFEDECAYLFASDTQTQLSYGDSNPIDMQYPNYRKLFPRAETKCHPVDVLGSSVLAQVVLSARAFGGDTLGIHIFSEKQGKEHPHVFLFPSVPEFFGVMMPVQHETPASIPDWLELEDEAAQPPEQLSK